MTKKNFACMLAKSHGYSLPYAEKILNAVLDSIEDGLFRDGKAALRGIGSFEVREQPEREGRNPATGQPIRIPACRVVRFRPSAAIREFLE